MNQIPPVPSYLRPKVISGLRSVFAKRTIFKKFKKIANGLGVSLNYVLKPLDKGNKNPAIEMLTNEKFLSFFEFLSEGSYQELELIKNISKAILDEIKKYNRLKKS